MKNYYNRYSSLGKWNWNLLDFFFVIHFHFRTMCYSNLKQVPTYIKRGKNPMHFQLMKTCKQGLTQQLHWYRDSRKQVNQCLRTKYRSKLNPNVYIKIAFVKGVYRTISKRKNSISNGNKWHFKFCHNKKNQFISFLKCSFIVYMYNDTYYVFSKVHFSRANSLGNLESNSFQ